MRRSYLLRMMVCGWGLLTTWTTSTAAQELNVLPATAESPLSGRLYQWLRGQAQTHFDARRKTVAGLQTADAIRERQQALRQQFIEALGGFPERTPLNAQITGTIEASDYRIEKVIYESRPLHHVTACLYIPKGTGPFPGVLVPCGHSANGKAAEAYQRIAILLAKNGLAALCYDPIGQGERSQLLTPEGRPAISASTSEHTMIGVGALLVGSSCATYRIWDGIRSLDYLASRPEIDATRLGCTGNSGGGTLTAYLMALDDRIQAAAPSCYITSLERLFATIGPQDAEQNITGQVAFGMEHADYITMRAPRPTLICVGTQDFFDISGSWSTYREAKSVYGILGHGERVDLFEFNDTHGFSLPRRQAAMRWMRRWLLQQDDAPLETDFPVHTDLELQCTRTGQVLQDLQGVSAYDLNRLRATELQAAREAQPLDQMELKTAVRHLIQLPLAIPTAKVSSVAMLSRDGYTIEKQMYETESGIVLPANLWQPTSAPSSPQSLILFLHDQGKQTGSEKGGLLEQWVREGQTVLAVDLRGLGELAPEAKGWGQAFGRDVREALLSLHLNRPLLGQRVLDLLSVVQAAEPLANGQPVAVHAVGITGPVALHAALFAPELRVHTEKSLESWTAVAQTPISHNQLSNVVPNALRTYDLPDLLPNAQPKKTQ